jgi:Periplasmic protein involved in polysaccharide export
MKKFLLVLLVAPLAAFANTTDDAQNATLAREFSPASTASPDYRISPRDLVQFQVFNQPDMTIAQRVSANGELRLPLLGTYAIAGRTLREAEDELEKLYRSRGFFVSPQVILSVEEYGERYVSILGQVKNPERIPLSVETKSIGILQAITQSGGFTRVARTDQVQVLRVSPEGREERLVVNVDDLLRPGRSSVSEFQLQSGDIVFVPERVF